MAVSSSVGRSRYRLGNTHLIQTHSTKPVRRYRGFENFFSIILTKQVNQSEAGHWFDSPQFNISPQQSEWRVGKSSQDESPNITWKYLTPMGGIVIALGGLTYSPLTNNSLSQRCRHCQVKYAILGSHSDQTSGHSVWHSTGNS